MTRRQGHEAVLKSLDVALASPKLESVKLNVVIIRGLNDSEVLDFVEMTKEKPISVRFIEFMPFTGEFLDISEENYFNELLGNKWDKEKMVPSAELLAQISNRHPHLQREPDEVNETARSWKVPGYRGSLGFISSMSDHFCATCNRLRITADGQIKVVFPMV
jgi:molybdenum cofactor biosynthesis enzyme MoaA